MKSILRAGVAAAGLSGFASAFIHPFGLIKAQRSNEPLFAGAETIPELTRVFERSCQNCHSERTNWPWYSYLPPLSWLIENDVSRARSHMNLSRWRDYTTDQQAEILSRLGAEVPGSQAGGFRSPTTLRMGASRTSATDVACRARVQEAHRLKRVNVTRPIRGPSASMRLSTCLVD